MMGKESATLRASYPCIQITVENRDYHYLSRFEIGGAKRIYQHLFNIGCLRSRPLLQKLSGSEPSWSLGRAIRLQSSSLVASYVACLIQNDSGFWVFGGIRSGRLNFLRKRRDSMKKRGWLPLEIR